MKNYVQNTTVVNPLFEQGVAGWDGALLARRQECKDYALVRDLWGGKVNSASKYPITWGGWDLASPMISDFWQRSPSFSANVCLQTAVTRL